MVAELYKLPASFALYYLGCAACWFMELRHKSERWSAFWYPIYNWLMVTSADLDVKARFWKPPDRS